MRAAHKTIRRTPAKKAAAASKAVQPTYLLEVGGREVAVKGRSVFEELGFSQAETADLLSEVVDEVLKRRNRVKDQLVQVLEGELKAHGLTVTEMAAMAAVSRPRLSNILNRDYEKFSIDAVVDVMHRFGKDVRVEVVDSRAMAAGATDKPAKPRSGRGPRERS